MPRRRRARFRGENEGFCGARGWAASRESGRRVDRGGSRDEKAIGSERLRDVNGLTAGVWGSSRSLLGPRPHPSPDPLGPRNARVRVGSLPTSGPTRCRNRSASRIANASPRAMALPFVERRVEQVVAAAIAAWPPTSSRCDPSGAHGGERAFDHRVAAIARAVGWAQSGTSSAFTIQVASGSSKEAAEGAAWVCGVTEGAT